MQTSVAQRQNALADRFPAWQARTLHAMLDAVAAEFPARDFVVTDGQTYGYADIKAWSERIAQGLQHIGVARGEHVAVVLANYAEFVAVKFAISRVGATCVPINFLNRRDELGYVLKQSDAVALITMDRFRNLDYLQALDELAPGWETGGGGGTLPKLRQVVVFATAPGPARRGAVTLEQLAGSHTPWQPSGGGDPAAVSDIIYTSGTTGSPKGVMLTHDMLLRAAFGSAYSRAFDDGWRIIFALPMYHVYGYVEGMLSALFVAGAIIPQLAFEPATLLRGIGRHKATDILLVPTMTQALLAELRLRDHDLASLRAVLSSGQRSPVAIWQDIFDLLRPQELTTGYGMTECTATTTLTLPHDTRAHLTQTNGCMRNVGPAGDPAQGGRLVDYRVVDPQTGRDLPPGEVGELVAKGPGVTRGYYNKLEETAQAFDADGWFRTGDLGRFDGDGYLTLEGRLKETYRCGGEQVMPTEIEDVLTSHAGVLQAHVVPVPDHKMGEAGAAFVVLLTPGCVTPQELMELCADRLARFKVPKYVLPIRAEDLPVTPSGRARKFLLTQRATAALNLL